MLNDCADLEDLTDEAIEALRPTYGQYIGNNTSFLLLSTCTDNIFTDLYLLLGFYFLTMVTVTEMLEKLSSYLSLKISYTFIE